MLDPQRSFIRETNERLIRELQLFRSTYVLRCECGDDGCTRPLTVHEDEYRLALRRHGHIVAFDHVNAGSDRTISCSGEVCIVVPRRPDVSTGPTASAPEAATDVAGEPSPAAA